MPVLERKTYLQTDPAGTLCSAASSATSSASASAPTPVANFTVDKTVLRNCGGNPSPITGDAVLHQIAHFVVPAFVSDRLRAFYQTEPQSTSTFFIEAAKPAQITNETKYTNTKVRQKNVQTTVDTTVAFEGKGLHLGRPVSVVVRPAPADHGIVFCLFQIAISWNWIDGC